MERKDPSWPYSKHGIIQNYGVGHLQKIWDLRCNQDIGDIFSYIYTENGFENAEDLCVSMDGICVMYPYSDRSLSAMTTKLHLDQHPGIYSKPFKGYTGPELSPSSFSSIQGFVTLEDMYADHGTLRLISGSHHYHADLVRESNRESKWWSLSPEHYDFLILNGCKDIRIPQGSNSEICNTLGYIPAGSLVIWDSRVVHCAEVHRREIPQDHRRWRYIVYISYQPKSLISTTMLKKRISAFENLRMTGHLVSNPFLFPIKPDSRYDKRDHIQYYNLRPIATERMRSLIGYPE